MDQNFQIETKMNRTDSPVNFSAKKVTFKAQIYSSLGDAYQQQKKYKESVAAYENALALDPNNIYTLNNYAYYLSLREENLAKAEEMSLKTNRLEKDNASFQDTYAWILFKGKKYEEAKIWMQKAILNNQNSAVQFEHLGDILFQLGETENALQNWKKALILEPENMELKKKINQK